MELTINSALQKGIQAHKAGRLEEADRFYTAILKVQPKHSDANHNMGVLAIGVGKVEQSLSFFKLALETNSAQVQFWCSYIDALIKLGRIFDAKEVLSQAKEKGLEDERFFQLNIILNSVESTTARHFETQDPTQAQLQLLIDLYAKGKFKEVLNNTTALLKQFPNSFTLYNIKGVAYTGLQQFDLGIASYESALKINQDFPEAYSNLGLALKDKGELARAVTSCRKAIELKPDFSEAYYNMGLTLFEIGDLEAALESFKQAIKLNPYSSQAYNNLGLVQKEKGDLEKAITSYEKAIELKPGYDAAYYNMGDALIGVTFSKPQPKMSYFMLKILQKETFAPKEIEDSAVRLLKWEPALQKAFERHAAGKLVQDAREVIAEISGVPLLLKLMSICPLADLELEVVLRELRSALLLSSHKISNFSGSLRFQSCLALQCFTNEYIYNVSDEEYKALQELKVLINKVLSNAQQPAPYLLLCLASYEPLNYLEKCELIKVNSDIEEVFIRQLIEPKQEKLLKYEMNVLQEVTDEVSSKVKEQYEENPYPRWVNLKLPLIPFSISKAFKEMKLRLYDFEITKTENPNILVAGCGTGQHSITTASAYKNSEVLAVDLSLSSLAYAKRKTKELGIKNIEYMQGDILDLEKLNKQFDIVESSGVLHHMNDPMAGWRVLIKCLRPGGLMKIGLYSELARQSVVKIREEINALNVGTSAGFMKVFRKDVIESNYQHHKQILFSYDFYSLSTLRDLLFHTQEHRFSLPEIKYCLSELGLEFCGFDKPRILQKFQLIYPDVEDPYDLDKWHLFEKAYPLTFRGMYQFWCQKVV